MIAATATAIAEVDAVVVAAAVASATIAVNALKAQPSAMRTPKHALRAKMAATAEVQNAAIAMVNVASEQSAVNAVKMPTPMATMRSTLKISMLKSLIQARLTRAMKHAQKEPHAEKADASAAKAAENVVSAVSVATTKRRAQTGALKTQKISGQPKLS
jgi:hypothetical protein